MRDIIHAAHIIPQRPRECSKLLLKSPSIIGRIFVDGCGSIWISATNTEVSRPTSPA
jgi:hypothetical protein